MRCPGDTPGLRCSFEGEELSPHLMLLLLCPDPGGSDSPLGSSSLMRGSVRSDQAAVPALPLAACSVLAS